MHKSKEKAQKRKDQINSKENSEMEKNIEEN